MKKSILLLVMLLVLAIVFAGCGENNTVQQYVISNEQYTDKASLKNTVQPEQITANQIAYASVYFIESPKGMKYTAKWYIDGIEVKAEEKETINDKQDVIVYSLDAEQVTTGTLKFEVQYDETILCSKEIVIQ